jgi:laminin subunit alpha-1
LVKPKLGFFCTHFVVLIISQVFQVDYVKLKAATSRLPGNWVLERSIDGIDYKPWQYFALSNTDCWKSYGTRPVTGAPHYRADDEVICVAYHPNMEVHQYGEIHVSLTEGRPGAHDFSETLKEFSKARFVRLRLQKIQTSPADLSLLGSSSDLEKRTINRVSVPKGHHDSMITYIPLFFSCSL